MASSSSSATRALLEDFLGGRLSADRLVAVVAARYYQAAERSPREALRPLMDVIERAAPGVVQLARTDGGPGFDIRLAERRFPAAYEPELRRAAEVVLSGEPGTVSTAASSPQPGFWGRLLGRVRRLFSASA